MPPCVIEKDRSRALYTVMWLCTLAAWCVSVKVSVSERESNVPPPAEEAETDALLSSSQSRNHQTSESKDR